MADWSTSAFVFPGQGSQVVGMGKDLAAAFPIVAETFAAADDALGYKLSDLCFDGPDEQLNNTIYTQPALYVMGVAILRALQSANAGANPAVMAGHSLGELTALTAAGAMPFEAGLHLVAERGRLMAEAGRRTPGAMAAILGLDAEPIRALCATASENSGQIVVMANDNCPGQVVISGEESALEEAMTLAKAAGAKRALKLAVSIAAHSPLMASASAEFRQAIGATPFTNPSTPIISNVGAAPLETVDAIRAELEQQLTQPVRWTESIQAIRALGISHFYEFGSKDVLCGLIKRIDREAVCTPLNSAATLTALIESSSS